MLVQVTVFHAFYGWVIFQRQTLYYITCMWNLKSKYKSTYLQNKNRLTDQENKPWLPKRQGRRRTNQEYEIIQYRLLYVTICSRWEIRVYHIAQYQISCNNLEYNIICKKKTLNNSALYLKLAQYCKSTICQLKSELKQ